MNNADDDLRAKTNLRLQAMAFLLIVLPSLGLYLAVASSLSLVIWLLMAIIAAAMILAVCAS